MSDDDPVLTTKGGHLGLESAQLGEGLLVNDPVAPPGDRHQLEMVRRRQ